MMNPIYGKYTALILLIWALGLHVQAQGVLQTGTALFSFSNVAIKDSGYQAIYFKPGYGASLATNPADSSGFHSIYEFEKDSVYHFLRSKKSIRLPAMSIQQLLQVSKTKADFKVTIGKEKKNILGYECFDFVAKASSGKDNTTITGWATHQIQTPMGIIMDPDLISAGFLMEFTMSDEGAPQKKVIAFSAVRILPNVDPRVFIHRK